MQASGDAVKKTALVEEKLLGLGRPLTRNMEEAGLSKMIGQEKGVDMGVKLREQLSFERLAFSPLCTPSPILSSALWTFLTGPLPLRNPPLDSPPSSFLPVSSCEGNLQLPNPILLAFLALCFWFCSSTETELN